MHVYACVCDQKVHILICFQRKISRHQRHIDTIRIAMFSFTNIYFPQLTNIAMHFPHQ